MKKNQKLLELYYYLNLPRYIENRMLLLLRQGKISKWFSGIGQEAIAVGTTLALNDEDVILPMHRNLGVFTTRKINLNKLFCQLFGKDGGYTKGRDRTFHFGHIEKNIIGMISHLAAMLPVAAGLSLGFKLNKTNRVAVAFVGDGATSEGDFHESLNLASVWKLPVIFIIENNGYGLSTPTSEQYYCKDLIDRAKGYGMKGKKIDGNNVLEVFETIIEFAEKIRQNPQPILIEAKTFRMRGHEEASGIKYVPKELIKYWQKRDPIVIYEKLLIKKKILNLDKKNKILKEIEKKVLPSIEYALNSKKPSSSEKKELNDVYKKIKINTISPNLKYSKEIRFIDSIKEALMQKLKQDKSVVILGQDIAEYGGVFKATEGFYEEFGQDRIKNTPITESAVIGAAMGMSFEGFKPIVEMQFADFVSVGFNQIVNNLAKTFYRWGQNVNVTLRLPTGGGIGAGPFHSQSNEAWFFHVPGLKLVYPSNPYDAKGLLVSSIDDPNPVLFFEHKFLYRSVKCDVPKSLYNIEIGKLNVVKEGSDLTVITYGLGVHWINEYSKKSIYDIEILDLRTLLPIDVEGFKKSIKKTNRVLILHEDNITGGIGAEISSIITENYFEHLDAPVLRLGAIDTPIPFDSEIEKNIYMPLNKIDSKINKLMSF